MRVQVNLGETPDGRANRRRSGHVFHQRSDAAVTETDTRSAPEPAGHWQCLTSRVLGEWGTTLRLGLLLVLLVAAGMTVVVLVAQWAPALGLALTSTTGVGLGALSGVLISLRRTAGL